MKVAAIICYILQILGMIGGARSQRFYFMNLFENLFFFNGVPGFSYALGQFFFLFLGMFFMSRHKKNLKKKEKLQKVNLKK